MRLVSVSLALLLSLLAGCTADQGGSAVTAAAPAIGAADGADRASRDCEIVLREVTRAWGDDGDYLTECDGGACQYVWRGAIDVAESALQPGDSVHVLYRRSDDDSWWAVAAARGAAQTPTYERFDFTLDEHVLGPDDMDGSAALELIAFLQSSDGARLFDHNSYRDDLENATLSERDGYTAYDRGVCRPQVAHIDFDATWGYSQWGDFRQDGYIAIEFALERLPECRSTHNGYPAWDTVGYARFSPGGQLVQQSVRAFLSDNGHPTTVAEPVPFLVEIPDDATSVEIWFHNFSGAGSTCASWDSNWGANYRFRILGAPGDSARCDGYELWQANYSRPACLGYDVSAHYGASHCEVFLDGLGHAREAHYGIPQEWLEAYLHAPAADGAVENVGMWLRYTDDAGEQREHYALGSEVSPGVYRTGFHILRTLYMAGTRVNTVEALAFFADVRRPSGEVVRLWQSRGGANYSWDDAFALPTTSASIPYGQMSWANPDAPIYDARRACQ